MTPPCYRIRGWSDHFETYESKRLKGLHWVPMPCKHDGRGIRRMMRRDPSGGLYGVWCLIVQVAAKCPERGTLADADGPLTALDIADKTGLSVESIESAISVLLSPEINWLETMIPPNSAGVPASSAGGPARPAGHADVHNITEHNITEHKSAEAPLKFETKTGPWELSGPKMAEYRQTFKGVDVDTELMKARQWCLDNPARRKTPGGMPRFLSAWLGKVQAPKSSTGGNGADFARLTVETLKSVSALVAWFETQKTIPVTHENELWTIAIARDAVGPKVEKPVALFVDAIKKRAAGQRNSPSDDSHEWAKVALRSHRAKQQAEHQRDTAPYPLRTIGELAGSVSP